MQLVNSSFQIFNTSEASLTAVDKVQPCHQISAEELYAHLRTNFYVSVPFAINAQKIQNAMDAFFSFLQLPEEIKMSIKAKIAPQHRRGELGLQRREGGDGIHKDRKEFFHYHPALLETSALQIESHPPAKAFIEHAHDIWNAATATLKELLGHLEKYCPGVYTAVFEEGHQPHLVLRFLAYEFQEERQQLAEAHFDAGSFTLAIAESCPGLRIGSCAENLKLVEHQPSQALFFLARNFEKMSADRDLLPAWHDVIKLPESSSLVGSHFQRWALVMFIEGHSLEAPSREETHRA